MKFGFSLSTISRVYFDYNTSGKTECAALVWLTRSPGPSEKMFGMHCNLTGVPRCCKSQFNVGDCSTIHMRILQHSPFLMEFWSLQANLGATAHSLPSLGLGTLPVDAGWLDELWFQLFGTDGCLCMWRKCHKAMDPACQQETIQGGSASVMMWGVFSHLALEPLIRLQTSLTGGHYVSILGGHLHPFMTCMHSDGCSLFQNDNAPEHMTTVTRF